MYRRWAPFLLRVRIMEAEPRRPSPPVRPLPETGRAPAWRSADILRAAALVLGLWLAVRLLWVAYPLLFLSFLGLLFGLAVARSADFLERLHVPRGFGAALTVLAFLGVLVGLAALVGPSLRQQLGELRTAVPQAVDQIGGRLDRHQGRLPGQVLPSFGKGGPPQPAAEGGAASPAGRLPGDLSGQLGVLTRYL